jgi:hypothetical protein
MRGWISSHQNEYLRFPESESHESALSLVEEVKVGDLSTCLVYEVLLDTSKGTTCRGDSLKMEQCVDLSEEKKDVISCRSNLATPTALLKEYRY